MTIPAARVLSTLVLAAFASSPSGERASPCAATTTLEGPADLTTAVARGLEAHGVAIGARGTCPDRTVRARLAAGPSRGTLSLHIEDGYGRISDRVLADTATAVSLIESWAIDEESDLLRARAPAPVGAPSVAVIAAPAATAAGLPLRLYGGLGSTAGSDRSVWASALLGGCVGVGRACVGGELSGGLDLGLAGDTADPGTTRSGADLLVIGAVPLVRGRWLLMPKAGLGAGWVRTRVLTEDPDAPVEVGNTFGLRAALGALAGFSVSRAMAVALDVGVVAAPQARPSPAEQSRSSLPGEPRLAGRATIGCVVTP
jgi:hypothetical protein